MSTPAPEPFRITPRPGGGYDVSLPPSYDGGEVVSAEVYDQLKAEHDALVSHLTAENRPGREERTLERLRSMANKYRKKIRTYRKAADEDTVGDVVAAACSSIEYCEEVLSDLARIAGPEGIREPAFPAEVLAEMVSALPVAALQDFIPACHPEAVIAALVERLRRQEEHAAPLRAPMAEMERAEQIVALKGSLRVAYAYVMQWVGIESPIDCDNDEAYLDSAPEPVSETVRVARVLRAMLSAPTLSAPTLSAPIVRTPSPADFLTWLHVRTSALETIRRKHPDTDAARLAGFALTMGPSAADVAALANTATEGQ